MTYHACILTYFLPTRVARCICGTLLYSVFISDIFVLAFWLWRQDLLSCLLLFGMVQSLLFCILHGYSDGAATLSMMKKWRDYVGMVNQQSVFYGRREDVRYRWTRTSLLHCPSLEKLLPF
jgi:hypothetical protein